MGCKPKDLIGMRFGHLLAIEMLSKDDPHCKKRATGCRQWLCKCDCGNEKIVESRSLISGHTKSCGCRHYELGRPSKGGRRGVDLTGKRFGYLTVMCKTPKEYRPSYTRVWLCMCDCGNETYASTSELTKGLKKRCGFGCALFDDRRKCL